MRASSATIEDHDLGRAVERLEALPIRPAVARQVFAVLTEEIDPTSPDLAPAPLVIPPATETDPGWALARSSVPHAGAFDPAAVLIEQRWWSSTAPSTSTSAAEALTRLWRHSVAVAFSARRLAREANDPDPDRVGRAGLLHHLGLWAVAAVDPDRLAAWIAANPAGRSVLEDRWFGMGLAAVGRRLAERWGCDPLVIDAVWLHADGDGNLNGCATCPDHLGLIQRAYAQARRTPWSVDPDPTRDFAPTDPRVRILTAEVQSRCGAPFVAPDASAREEWLTRDNLRLRRDLARSVALGSSADRLVASLADAPLHEAPQTWADRAALAWCAEPGVASAQVVWRSKIAATKPEPGLIRPPSASIPLGDPDHPAADLLVWAEPRGVDFTPSPTILAAWNGWVKWVADRERIAQTLDRAVAGHRGWVAADEVGRRQSTLGALAEFAAGAGHELNNPLAVIMGRAQLLLAKSGDADTSRSLRAIITQAQRTHRILRDLMFVARPADPRPRACHPDEIVRASLRDLEHEAEAQGVRLVLETRETAPKVWADPEPLRQVADILTRNALEASPTGATVRFSTGGDAWTLRWVVHDSGRGIAPAEGTHLFDPFFCGRQAGRGLGLGLPRVARIVEQAGGDIRWHSTPGQGATWQVTLPVNEIPAPVPLFPAEPTTADRPSPTP